MNYDTCLNILTIYTFFLNETFCSILYQYSSCKMCIEQSLTKKVLKNAGKFCILHVTKIMKWTLFNVDIETAFIYCSVH